MKAISTEFPVRSPVITLILMFGTFMAFTGLYAPQPLQPFLQLDLGLTVQQSTLFMVATLVPLTFAPVVYGFVLARMESRLVLQGGFLLLALAQVPWVVSDDFSMLLGSRFFQGLLYPAVFTVLMKEFGSGGSTHQVRKSFGLYIFATMLGGAGGRLLGGLLAGWMDWRTPFLLLLAGFLVAALLSGWVHNTQTAATAETGSARRGMRAALANPLLLRLYLVIFLVFFCFAAIMNFIPFRLRDLNPDFTEAEVAFVYLGYLTGLAGTLGAAALARWMGGFGRTVLLGMVGFLLSLLLFLPAISPLHFVAMFPFCGALFLVHTLLSGQASILADKDRHWAAALYISSYYTGVVLGSYLPGLIYVRLGWGTMIGFLVLLILLATSLIGRSFGETKERDET